MKPSKPHQHNRVAWNRMARQNHRLARPARDQDFADPLKSVDSRGWLGKDIRGKRVLCLAAGGGRQGPIYAAAGAIVTVVDIACEMLELDRNVAAENNLSVRTVEASMDDLSELGDATFDIVTQPVSTCYVPDIAAVFKEVARVLGSGGIYISQHKQPSSLQASLDPDSEGVYRLESPYYRNQSLPPIERDSLFREPGTVEYIHRWEQIIGGMCQAGFLIEDLSEPLHAETDAAVGEFGHRSMYVAPYVRIKARRTESDSPKSGLWTS